MLHVDLHQLVSFYIRHVASPWRLLRGGLGSLPACPPRTLCTFYGHAYGMALSGSRDNSSTINETSHGVGDTMVRHARQRPYAWTQQNTATLPLYNQRTNENELLQTTGPPRECKDNQVRRREYALRHASPVARAPSSRLMPTENQPRWGCLQDKAFGPGPGPCTPKIWRLMRRCDGTHPHVSSAQERGM